MGLEEASEKLDQALSQQSEAPASDSSQESSAASEQAPSMVDLDKVEKFTYGGKEWTAKELQSAIMMNADYTRKTQALAEERKYVDNLQADLEAIKMYPQLADKFREVYPEKYHAYLNYVLKDQDTSQITQVSQSNKAQYLPIDPTIMNRFETIEKHFFDQEVKAASANIDNIYSKMTAKYSMADERTVTATAQALLESKENLTSELWEKIFKDDHDRNKQRYDSYYKGLVDKQQKSSKVARDIGPGGGTAEKSGKKLNFKEATEMAINELSNRRA